MAERGTIESIAIALGRLFQPLEEELRVGRVRVLFADLGLVFPPELENQTALINALGQAVNEIKQLPEVITELIDAIQDEDFSKITSVGTDLFSKVKLIVENIIKIADEVKKLAGAFSSIPPSEINTFAENLPKNLLDYLLVRNLEGTPGLTEAFQFIGAIEMKETTSGGLTYTTRKVKLDQFISFLSDPGKQLEDLYDWGKPTFDGVKLFQSLENLLNKASVPAIFDPTASPPTLDLIYLEAQPKTDVTPKGIVLNLLNKIEVESEEYSQQDWKAKFILNIGLNKGAQIIILSDGNISFVPPSGELSGEALLEWTAGNPNGTPYLILGQTGGSRLEAKQFSIKTSVGFSWDSGSKLAEGTFSTGGEVNGGKLFIDFSQGDGFLSQVLSNVKLESDFNVGFGFSSRDGIFFYGSSSLSIQLPLHLNLGFVDVKTLTIGVGLDRDKIPTNLSVNINANLGPLQAVIEQMGIKADIKFSETQKGNLGPVDVQIGFKPPNGVGLALDAGVIKGGGYLYFDFDREEYAGALELVFSEVIALKAIGLVTTRLPDGSKGFSLLIIITVEFGTGLQLGFGFTLLGVGGLLGLNRSVNIDPLKEGIRTGGINSIMFPENVIENAPRIISDLRRYFPPTADIFLLGPMAKIGWGTPTLISVSLGIILELPTVTITILGIIKVALPDENAEVLRLQVNFIGRFEPQNKLLWFYAELYDSRVLFITLEGGMGLLVNWGDQANFVVSVGGFHPRYSPPPLPFPEPPRIAITILNESYAKVRVEAYFAVTSNSVQFGARVELFFGLSEFKIEGHLAFDALFQFDPFFFSFSLSVSLSVKVFGVGLFSVGFSGLLEGPTPWHIKGRGEISLLFFSISVPFEQTWGEKKITDLSPIDVLPLLKTELSALTNWQAVLPPGRNILVSLRKLGDTEADALVLHPVGFLQISQRKVPLNLTLEKYGNQVPNDVSKLSISQGGNWQKLEDIQEQFAIGQYTNLEESKKLSSPDFQYQDSGLKVSAAGDQLRTRQAVKRMVRYETIIIDNNYKRHVVKFFDFVYLGAGFGSLYNTLFTHFVAGSAVSNSVLSHAHRKQVQPFEEVIHIQPHQYSVASTQNNQPLNGSVTSFNSKASAEDYRQQLIREDPFLADSLHVLPNSEILV